MLSNIQKNHYLVNKKGVEYYTVDNIEVVHKEMLRLLLIIDTIAKDSGISYWIDGGSLIGIVRHHGFIPWDDDMDISMLKDDYLKLVKELSLYCKIHNDVALFYEEPLVDHTCNYFASKSVFLRTEGSCTIVPVKIDIRPVNCIENSEISIKDNCYYRDMANYILFKKTYGYISTPLSNEKDIKDFFRSYNYEYGLGTGDYSNMIMVHPYFEFSNTFRLTYDHLFPQMYIPFENIELPVPRDYKYLLTQLYGDFMSMPDLCNRAPVSCQVYQKTMSDDLYKVCLSLFKRRKRNVFDRCNIIISQIRLLGLCEYIKIKCYE